MSGVGYKITPVPRCPTADRAAVQVADTCGGDVNAELPCVLLGSVADLEGGMALSSTIKVKLESGIILAT